MPRFRLRVCTSYLASTCCQYSSLRVHWQFLTVLAILLSTVQIIIKLSAVHSVNIMNITDVKYTEDVTLY